jgi:hypothetical protein
MAADIPAVLKTADITQFVHRGAQLATFDPVISYWCRPLYIAGAWNLIMIDVR